MIDNPLDNKLYLLTLKNGNSVSLISFILNSERKKTIRVRESNNCISAEPERSHARRRHSVAFGNTKRDSSIMRAQHLLDSLTRSASTQPTHRPRRRRVAPGRDVMVTYRASANSPQMRGTS